MMRFFQWGELRGGKRRNKNTKYFSNFEEEIVPHVAANYKHLGESSYTRVEQL